MKRKEKTRVILQYPEGTNLFLRCVAWSALDFDAKVNKNKDVVVTETDSKRSLKKFFTSRKIRDFKRAGVKVKLSWM